MRALESLVVATGGAVGAGARWAVGETLTTTGAPGLGGLPWWLLLVNTVGSFGLGLVAFRTSTGSRELVRLGVGVGFCGGLTTFSSFSVATSDLWRDGDPRTAVGLVILSVFAGLGALALGATIRRRWAGGAW
ncbi:MAG: fluoride efflux transporter FluC [Acidimicrobiales bacterium]